MILRAALVALAIAAAFLAGAFLSANWPPPEVAPHA